ncbi:Arf-GAP domain and FG repeat-containing protein 1 [Trichoplax sp. H2]|nr:Arf-GAP domain and FG repeat-containing protein 1 [Trichoplax sp. H2]|eukprot:RDD46057.1 Arf-GAP domain and FG repeat-containing protein 1 [Trichoplax sp. H2]
MASQQKKLDENNLKILRSLVSQEHNKRCFECRQRGPTYVDVTVYSFVCTMCSGLLRGLNPPHRVKSMSMTSFSAAEMDNIKSYKGGNLACQRVWLGKHEIKTDGPLPDAKDEQKLKKFLVYKYEKKTWYLDPAIALKDLQNQADSEVKPLSQLVGAKTTPLVVANNINQSSPKIETKALARPTGTTSPTSSNLVGTQQQNSQPTADPFGNFSSDPFGSNSNSNDNFGAFTQSAPGSQQAGNAVSNDFANFGSQQPTQSGGGFANFDSQPAAQPGGGFANFDSQPAAQPANNDFTNFVSHTSTQPVNNQFASFGSQPQNNDSTSSTSGGKSAYDIFRQGGSTDTVSETNSGTATPVLQSNTNAPASQPTPSNTTTTTNDDRYAAISGLDSLRITDTVTSKETGFSLSSSNPNPFGSNISTDTGSFQGSQWQQQPQTSVFGTSSTNINPMSSMTSSQGFSNTPTTSVFSNMDPGQMQQSSFGGGQYPSTQSFAKTTQQSSSFGQNIPSQNAFGPQFNNNQMAGFGGQSQSNFGNQQFSASQQGGGSQQQPTSWGQTPSTQQWGQTSSTQQWGQTQSTQQWGQTPSTQQWGQTQPANNNWGQSQQQQQQPSNNWGQQQSGNWGQQQQPSNNWQQQSAGMNRNPAQGQQTGMNNFAAVGMTAMAANQFGKTNSASAGFQQQAKTNPFMGGGGSGFGDIQFFVLDGFLLTFELRPQTANYEELKQAYLNEVTADDCGSKATFNYAYGLIFSRANEQVKKGISLIEELCYSGEDQRDYLYLLAVGHFKLKDYNYALKYIERVLAIEPSNNQGNRLKQLIMKNMQIDGLKGIAIVGGIIAVAAGVAFAIKR